MNVSTKQRYKIASAEQLRLLTSSVRQEVVDSLMAMGPSTIRDLAEMLGMSQDGLYYHMRLLTASGLVVEDTGDGGNGREAVVYRLAAKEVRLDYDAGREARSEICNIVGAALRTATREFTTALESERAVTEGPGRNLWGGRRKGWLSPAELERLNVLLEEIFHLLESAKPGGDRQLYSFTLAMSPADPRPLRRSDPPPRGSADE
ncbi:MAG TPA: helix-turn-helix domain-containing protein [Acidobacteriota bacterium]|nr:helix-turn-helix domain-containing protein [Acidobacteriota bacterium]